MRGVILEGLSGAGKSSVLSAIRRIPGFAAPHAGWVIHDEEATMGATLVSGDVMDELADSRMSDSFRWRRLDAVLAALESSPAGAVGPGRFILERFHLTYYTLMPDRGLLAEVDARAAALGAGIVLLTYPASGIATRALRRPDREGTEWLQRMLGGRDESAVVERLAVAATRYREALSLSNLPSLVLDTASMDWDGVARQVAEFAGAPGIADAF